MLLHCLQHRSWTVLSDDVLRCKLYSMHGSARQQGSSSSPACSALCAAIRAALHCPPWGTGSNLSTALCVMNPRASRRLLHPGMQGRCSQGSSPLRIRSPSPAWRVCDAPQHDWKPIPVGFSLYNKSYSYQIIASLPSQHFAFPQSLQVARSGRGRVAGHNDCTERYIMVGISC